MSSYLAAGAGSDGAALDICRAMAESIHRTGVLVVRDPRVSAEDNATFQTLMQRYYSQPEELLLPDARPDLFYQVGVTPDLKETALCATDTDCHDMIEQLSPEDRPLLPTGPDPKWRFFWRVGERPSPSQTEFAELNAPAVVPAAFPEWETTMDDWGNKLLEACSTVAEMIAIGWGQVRFYAQHDGVYTQNRRISYVERCIL